MLDAFVNIAISGRRALSAEEYRAPLSKRWASFSVPHRPTPEEVELYRSFIGGKAAPDAKVIVFGATPELRDLLAEEGMKPLLVDISEEMLRGMLSYARSARASDETWLKSDWLAAALPQDHFDLVIGDLFLRHVPPDRQRGLLAKIASLCAPGAKVVMRVHARNPAYANRAWSEILDEGAETAFRERKDDAMGILHSRLLDRSAADGRASRERIVAAVRGYLATARPPLFYRMFLHEFLDRRALRVSDLAVPERRELEGLLGERFSIVAEAHDGTYPESAWYPVLLLKRI